MKKLVSILMVAGMLAACGGGGGASTPEVPPSVDATGTWSGKYTSSLTGSETATLSLVQDGAALTGNYAVSGGGLGTVSGSVSDKTATFTINVTTPGCSGSLAGKGIINTTVTPPSMAFTYNGATNTACGGNESGTGNLVKQ